MAKRKVYNCSEYILDEEKQILILSKDYHRLLLGDNKFSKFKKFGGSSIGNILLTDNFKSHFSAFLHMARLGLPVLQRKYVNAGIALEPKIFDLLHHEFPNLDIQHIEAEKVNYDYFSDKHKILGGVPDGLVPSKKMVLEMKTVQEKSLPKWLENDGENVPTDYRKQAQLYAYLLGYNQYSIVALFLKPEDYEHPEYLDITTREIRQFRYKTDISVAKDDIDKIIKFYNYYSQSGISPQYSAIVNRDEIDYLRCHNRDEWESLFNHWKALGKIDKEISFDEV
ncbi:MAGa7180 family putative nuclease [Mycoplasmopsis opalescens]|uniref:MAGa7180 family putative nuclease n=1 Tax=Mycoplasmopsis opalescens TaxID=114886 RepID=UPI0004A6AA15|nr:YqaJ viral recombinase family protein [Mycoplasmopsis opalescens]